MDGAVADGGGERGRRAEVSRREYIIGRIMRGL